MEYIMSPKEIIDFGVAVSCSALAGALIAAAALFYAKKRLDGRLDGEYGKRGNR
jgi:hypothetical protein